MISIGVKELLEAGVHFGHQTKRWNPKMKRFIFDARNGIHIIDLAKTVTQLDAACEFMAGVVRKGGSILFVGTKKQAQEAIKETAKACAQHYMSERWLGGTLTNFNTIKKSIARLKHIEKMEADGSIKKYVKQEQSMLRREANRLVKHFDGIRLMEKYPSAMFIIDVKREHNAVAEGRRLGIPIVAITDTNCDPDPIDYPIAGNDDAIRSIRVVLTTVVQKITEAKNEYDAKFARKKAEEEAAAAKAAEEAANKAAAHAASLTEAGPVKAPSAPTGFVTPASAPAPAPPAPAPAPPAPTPPAGAEFNIPA